MIELFAVTNRGLENTSAEEMRRLPGLQIARVSYRRVSASYSGDPVKLLDLRIVDDIFLNLATWEGIHHQRSALAEMTRLAESLRLDSALEVAGQVRPLGPSPAFSVTANFVGRRNYNTDEIKNAISAGIHARYGWPYVDQDKSQINIRIFIEHEVAYVGLRLAPSPLHRRAYKQVNLPGSLKPNIAAAMLFIAGIESGERVLDPFCGAGTILIEAALSGARALGGDLDPQAREAAKTNAARAGVEIMLGAWDARAIPLRTSSVAQVVTNLPWGRQVEVGEELTGFYRHICAEMERILIRGGQVVALTNLPHLLSFTRGRLVSQTEISLFGQLPTIMKFKFE